MALACICRALVRAAPVLRRSIRDYVRAPPSLSRPIPSADMIEPALDERGRSACASTLTEWQPGRRRASSSRSRSSQELDARIVRYVDRSDLFDDAQLESMCARRAGNGDERRIKQQYFLFGTDRTAATCSRAP